MREFLVHSVFFGAAVSLVGYEVGLLLKRKFKMAIFNPLLIAILCVMAILTVGDISYDDYNQGAQYLRPAHAGNRLSGSSVISAVKSTEKEFKSSSGGNLIRSFDKYTQCSWPVLFIRAFS